MVNSLEATTETSKLSTVMPRWLTVDRGQESSETYEIAIPAETYRALSKMDHQPAVLAAAYAKVASVLTGEQSVSVGYRFVGCYELRPLQIAVRRGSWSSLIKQADQALLHSEARLSSGQPQENAAPEFETVLDVTGWAGQKGTGIDHDRLVLLWSIEAAEDSPLLQLKYRTDYYDEECISRYAGYYLRALDLLARDPAADHNAQSLVSSSELTMQLNALSGPSARFLEKPLHQLFSEQAVKTPDALAVTYGDRQCTYQELDRMANKIAHSLLNHGLGAEGVVVVDIQRSIEWIAVIIGVLRAGGVYLPVDPNWPADRLRVILRRAAPQVLVLDQATEEILSAIADSQGDTARAVTIGAAMAEPDDTDPGVSVSASQLAYIYFTSGSTGEPKGAMCEHAGMMNHLLAKLEDLGITSSDMLVQNAPATFDISLWQAVAPLLVGGATTVMSAETVRDIDGFIAEVGRVGATVIQVVPSYLETLMGRLSETEPAGRLPGVRHVVVTGEALKKGLVDRWFGLCDIPLTNAYGATEASDDTTHHMMRRPPESASVPVGKPIRNVRLLILDENLQAVPLGAPGEIAFGGVCVGRGYVNDEERTKMAFVDSGTEPPARIYRTGDYGRWGPDGTLKFLGRRDEQIKIRGVRVEIGEIENAILCIDGVRDAAVVVRRGADPDTGLVGYYTSTRVITAETLRQSLTDVLPEYMIPPHLCLLDSMPVTENSKIDKKALMDRLVYPAAERAEDATPQTETEWMLAGLWAELLDLPTSSVGRCDDFFDLGGSSLSAIRLVVRLGKRVSLLDIADSPVLSDLATVIDGKGSPEVARPTGPGTDQGVQ